MRKKLRSPISRTRKIAQARQYLKHNRLMTLCTTGNGKPWCATVFFAYDRKFNLLFFSRPETRHCQHIVRNPSVAIAINHYQRKNSVMGLQIQGRASRVPSKDISRRYKLYKSRFKWADDFKNDHALYIVRPREVHYIDKKFFGHSRRVRVV